MVDFQEIARQSRIKCLELVYKAQTSHIGSLFSAADIFAVLFEKIDLDKDRFVLSCGWKACLLYYHLWRKGRMTEDQLNSYCMDGSPFIGLAEPIIPEIAIAGGSMGLGFPGAVGIALAKKMKGEEGTVYCLMSDGELAIGTTWESLLIARQNNLSNLVVLIDRNFFQAMGKTKDILDIEPIEEKMMAFGWIVKKINGHDYKKLESIWEWISGDCPHIVICDTIKGKGWNRAEGNNLYHYKQISPDEYNEARQELYLLSKKSS